MNMLLITILLGQVSRFRVAVDQLQLFFLLCVEVEKSPPKGTKAALVGMMFACVKKKCVGVPNVLSHMQTLPIKFNMFRVAVGDINHF